MRVVADGKKRVVFPGARPDDVFICERQDENHYSLVKLEPLPQLKQKRMTKAQVLRAVKNSKMQFDMTWDELRKLTREP